MMMRANSGDRWDGKSSSTTKKAAASSGDGKAPQWAKNSPIDLELRKMIISGEAGKQMGIEAIRAFQAKHPRFAAFNENIFKAHYRKILKG